MDLLIVLTGGILITAAKTHKEIQKVLLNISFGQADTHSFHCFTLLEVIVLNQNSDISSQMKLLKWVLLKLGNGSCTECHPLSSV